MDIWSTSIRDGQDVDFLIFAVPDIDADIYFQYLRMRMVKLMQISMDVDADICSTSIRDGQG